MVTLIQALCLVAFVNAIPSTVGYASGAPEDWPMEGHDSSHTG
jgi:hypothetical protein